MNILKPNHLPLTSNKQLLQSYKTYRAISRSLITKFDKYLSKKSINQCAKKLGLSKRKTLFFNKEDEVSVLFNYCFFHHYIQDKNVIDRYLANNLNHLSDDEKQVLLVMQKSKFSIFAVEKTTKYGGVLVTDILRNRQQLLIDEGFSKTSSKGILLASTTLHYPEFMTTTGTALPLNNALDEFEILLDAFWDKYGKFDLTSKLQQSNFIAKILKLCIREEVSKNIEYIG